MALPIYTSAAFTGTTRVEVAANASVEVRSEADDSLVTLYSDRAGTVQINNPFQADAFGRFEFFANPNSDGWRITVTSGADSHMLRYQQPMGSLAGVQAGSFMMDFVGAEDAEDAVDKLGLTPIAFSAHKNGTAQTDVPIAPTKITFDTEEFDDGGFYDAANSTFTPPAGKYRLTVSLLYSSGLVDQSTYRALIYKNGAAFRQGIIAASGTGSVTASVTAVVEANGTDVFEAYAIGSGAGTRTISGDTFGTFFCGESL